jgi:hypothetical protein
MVDVGIFNGRLIYFMAFWYILLQFCIFLAILYIFGNLVHFFQFWYIVPRKIWQPCSSSDQVFYDLRFCCVQEHLHRCARKLNSVY